MPRFSVGDKVRITQRQITSVWPTFTREMLADASAGIVFTISEVVVGSRWNNKPLHYILSGSSFCEWTVLEDWIELFKKAKKNKRKQRLY